MKKHFIIITALFVLLASLGCDYFPPRTVEDGKTRLSGLVEDYLAECNAINPFGGENYEETENNLKLAKINDDYLTRARELLKQIEAIDPGEQGDTLKVLRMNAALYVDILETRAEAFSMVDESLSSIEQALYSARFAVFIGVANDEMNQLKTYLR